MTDRELLEPAAKAASVHTIGWLRTEGGRVSYVANNSPEAEFVASLYRGSYFPIMAHPTAVKFVESAIAGMLSHA